jgi:hypothetical protein
VVVEALNGSSRKQTYGTRIRVFHNQLAVELQHHDLGGLMALTSFVTFYHPRRSHHSRMRCNTSLGVLVDWRYCALVSRYSFYRMSYMQHAAHCSVCLTVHLAALHRAHDSCREKHCVESFPRLQPRLSAQLRITLPKLQCLIASCRRVTRLRSCKGHTSSPSLKCELYTRSDVQNGASPTPYPLTRLTLQSTTHRPQP